MQLSIVSFIATLYVFLNVSLQSVHGLPILERLGVVGKKFKGDGTYYAPGLGSCGEVDTDSDLVVAMNPYWMSNGEMCGKKIKATGPNGSVTVKVVDTCPGCAQNDLDFSEDAYDMIGDKEQGRIPISWKFI